MKTSAGKAPIRTAITRVRAGEIGTPFSAAPASARVMMSFRVSPIWPRARGFIIEDLGIHVLDIVRALMGDVTRVAAQTQRVNPAIKGEDVATILLSHADAASVVDCSYATKRKPRDLPRKRCSRWTAIKGLCTSRRAMCSRSTRAAASRPSTQPPPLLAWAEKPWHTIQDSVVTIQDHFIRCLATGAPPETSGADNLHTLCLVEAAYLSAAEGPQRRDGQPVTPVDRPAIAWLGDDFTGAAAVMEVLSFAGLPSLLFLDAPTPAQLAEARGLVGIGIASLARAHPPTWMDAHLPALYAALDQTRAELIHYKICTTLDSAPHMGSIGRAIELGRAQFGPAAVPVVTAAPAMRRYQAFGSLFCAAGDGVHRLDRHPVMAQHPVTPMAEADVARHLAAQTDLPLGCIDLEALAVAGRAEAMLEDPRIWTIDLMRRDEEARVGQLLWQRRTASRFVVGSQGVEYALAAHFRETGQLGAPPPAPSLGRAARFAVVSGSVSPISAAQIAHARAQGFAAIRLDVTALKASEGRALHQAKAALADGTPPLIFTAEGPGDLQSADQARIGEALGRILRALILEGGLTRVAVSGGDTSGRVCRALGIYALEAAAPTIPGAAICRARAAGALNGLEIALKGGQMGTPDYFTWVQDGGGAR